MEPGNQFETQWQWTHHSAKKFTCAARFLPGIGQSTHQKPGDSPKNKKRVVGFNPSEKIYG